MIRERIQLAYPEYFEENLLQEMEQFGSLQKFTAGDLLIDVNMLIQAMPIILNGIIKIIRDDANDGELLLYFLQQGDACLMSYMSSQHDTYSDTRTVAETDGEFVMLPVSMMDEWLGKYPSWRKFVLSSYNKRLDEMLSVIDNLAFNDMNGRLKNYLIEVAALHPQKSITKTHQEIATEMNTSRVVISRILKILEKENFLVLNRNYIKLL